MFLLALVARVAVLAELSAISLFISPQLDQLEFLRWAQTVGTPDPDWTPTHAPGYPHFLGILLRITDGSVTGARVLQAILGALSCVVATLIGARVFGRWPGIAAGLILAVYGPLVFVDVSLLAEGLFIFILTMFLWALTQPRQSAWALALAGLLVGLATVVRATALALVPCVLALVLLLRNQSRPRIRFALAFLLPCLAVVGPVALTTGGKLDSALFLQAFGGLNLYMGNDPQGDGTPSARLGKGWDLLSSEAFRSGYRTVGEQERYYFRRALSTIRSEPLAFLRLLGQKALWLIQAEEIRETHSFYFFRSQATLLKILPGFGLLFPFAICGMVIAVRQRSAPLVLLVYLGVFAATCVAIIVSSRYRLPMVPALALFAGVGVTWIVHRVRARDVRGIAIFGAGVVAAVVLSHLWTHASSRDFSEEWALTGSSVDRDGRLDEALDAFRKSVAIDPDYAYAWAGIGRIHTKNRELDLAEEAFRKAISADADYSRGYEGLAAVQQVRGQLAEAAASFQKALWLSPEKPALARDLGAVLVRLDRLNEAETAYRQALSLDESDAVSLLALARIAGARGDPLAGANLAADAVDIDPQNGEAWVMLAVLATQAHDTARARVALERAGQLVGVDAPEVRFAQALRLREEGHLDAADTLLRTLITDYPRFASAVTLFLEIAEQRGRLPEGQAFINALQSGGSTQ